LSIKIGSVLPVCKRCVYVRSRETAIIIDQDDKVRAILNYKGSNYYRRGECIGYSKCHQCFKRIDGEIKDLPCIFYKSKYSPRGYRKNTLRGRVIWGLICLIIFVIGDEYIKEGYIFNLPDLYKPIVLPSHEQILVALFLLLILALVFLRDKT